MRDVRVPICVSGRSKGSAYARRSGPAGSSRLRGLRVGEEAMLWSKLRHSSILGMTMAAKV